MISIQDNRIQQEITGVILVGRMYSISASSPEVMGIVEYDLPEAERQLSIWQSRHQEIFAPIHFKLRDMQKMKRLEETCHQFT